MSDLKSISGVEIFAAGRWNGDEYSVEDLNAMVEAFKENSATLKPSLKLGHDPDQKLLQQDGYPAAGWISNIYIAGSKLLADFVDIPSKVYELIERKAYRKVSSEIYWNIEVNGKLYKRLLSAVSLLGGDMPAVSTLNDILALYGVRQVDGLAVYAADLPNSMLKQYTLDAEKAEGQMEKTENELKLEGSVTELQEQKASLEQTVAQRDEQISAKEKELEELRKFKVEADKRAFDAEQAAQQAKREAFVAELEVGGLCTPAMKPYMLELLGEEKKEYSIAEKSLSKQELVTELLKLHSVAEKVNTEEATLVSDTQSKNPEADLNEKIKAYAVEHKCSYGTAYKAVLKQETKQN